jgi:proteic killer suppression protein
MIISFRKKALKRLFEDGKAKGIDSRLVGKLSRQLDALNAAAEPRDVGMWGLHPLTGERKGQWAISVTGNYRLTFEFENGEVKNVDLEDYH